MVVNVVPHGERRAVAYAAVALAMIVLPAAIVDDLVLLPLRAPYGGDLHLVWMRPVVELALWLAALGPMAVSARRTVRRIAVTDGELRGLRRPVRRGSVVALSVAAGAKGYSVGIATGDGVVFVETDRREDARALQAALSSVTATGDAARAQLERAGRRCVWRARMGWIVQLGLGLASAAATLAWRQAVREGTDASAGAVAVSLALLSVAFFVARVRGGGPLTVAGSETLRRHVDLHRERALDDEAVPEDAERAGLARGSATLVEWLTALDAASAQPGHAYRDPTMTPDALTRALEDAPSVEIKMAAARVLARRHGRAPAALVRVVTDPDERVRVAASLGPADEAAEELERLGPVFRAR